MIEVTIKNFLDDYLNVPIFFERPDPIPSRFVILEKIGSSKTNRLQSSTFAFQSYAESLYQAASLNELLKKAVEELTHLDVIGKIRLNSDYNYTDTSTKQYRYQAVYDISHY